MHDCRLGKCHPSVLHHQMQERQETSRTVSLISHEGDGCFVINMHALHNATLLHNILPRHLTAPKYLYTDRMAQHHEVAAQLRVTQVEKRARTAVKSKATRRQTRLRNKIGKLLLRKNRHRILAAIQMDTQIGVLRNIGTKVKFKGTLLTSGHELNSAEQANSTC